MVSPVDLRLVSNILERGERNVAAGRSLHHLDGYTPVFEEN